MSDFKTFESERLILKPTSEDDAQFILDLLNTPKWLKYIGDRDVKTLADAKAYIEKRITAQFNKLGYGNYTVTRKSDEKKIGSCGLYDREGLEGIDIGFAFLPQYERMGYAYESALKIKEIAINEFNINEIVAITLKENISSQKLLIKIGLAFEKMISIPNDDEELMLFRFTTIAK